MQKETSLFSFYKVKRHGGIPPGVHPSILFGESKGDNSPTFAKQTATGKWYRVIAYTGFRWGSESYAWAEILCRDIGIWFILLISFGLFW